MKSIIETRKFFFPIFTFLLALYFIVRGLSSNWVLWVFITVILDLLINPIYQKVTKETTKNAKDSS